MGTIRAIWALQDKPALTPGEETAIELKRDLVAGQERVLWNPARPLPPKELEPSQTEVTRTKAAIQASYSHRTRADRSWFEPPLPSLFSTQSD